MFEINENGFIRPIKPFPPREIMSEQEAVKKSVLKWKFTHSHIDDINHIDGWVSCALCHKHISGENFLQCRGCPIFTETGEVACYTTPYEEALELFDKYKAGKATKKEALDAIQKMIDYLERFLD